jgi:hypothetical protein
MSDKKTEDELEAELDREIDARLEDCLAQFKRAALHSRKSLNRDKARWQRWDTQHD